MVTRLAKTVRIAFEASKEADPGAKLSINNFKLDNSIRAKVATGMVDHVTGKLS